ncbi:MAG: phosphatidate cytidylyltransferase [Dysgonamonadaceae bacterium]|jgi:phosphatidate cytidylyltransferase|nr:phosphatidate cytidylyltransferase [Dysgonamonadaceae bacterium]
MKNVFVRGLTGCLYVALITGSILLNKYTFAGLFSILLFFCLKEFYSLLNTHKKIRISTVYHSTGGVLLFISAGLYASGTLPAAVFAVYLLYLVILPVSGLYTKQADPLAHTAYVLLGQCYIAFPFALLHFLVFPPDSTAYYPLFLLSLFVFIWVNDTGAFAVGTLFGKHRLFPRISPKKSWEGFFGGLFFTAASAFIFAYYEPVIPYYHWVGIAVGVAVFGTWGDLVESLIKRTFGIKDSGNALPGHGGFLDRLDSLLLAVYAALLYVLVIIQN